LEIKASNLVVAVLEAKLEIKIDLFSFIVVCNLNILAFLSQEYKSISVFILKRTFKINL
jgi:hypothetical protein